MVQDRATRQTTDTLGRDASSESKEGRLKRKGRYENASLTKKRKLAASEDFSNRDADDSPDDVFTSASSVTLGGTAYSLNSDDPTVGEEFEYEDVMTEAQYSVWGDEDEDDSDSESRDKSHHGHGPRDIPQRYLNDYAFFTEDATGERELCNLPDVFGSTDNLSDVMDLTQFQVFGVGLVIPKFVDDDDDDDDDDDKGEVEAEDKDDDKGEVEADDNDDDADSNKGDQDGVRVRLGVIKKIYLDYTDPAGELWIMTDAAWYILQQPSQNYAPSFFAFYKPWRVTQHIIAHAEAHPKDDYDTFLREAFFGQYDERLGRVLEYEDIAANASDTSIFERVCDAVSFMESPELTRSPLIQHCFASIGQALPGDKAARARSTASITKRGRTTREGTFTAIVQPARRPVDREAQLLKGTGRTCVTPLVAKLAGPFFPGCKLEVLKVPARSGAEQAADDAEAPLESEYYEGVGTRYIPKDLLSIRGTDEWVCRVFRGGACYTVGSYLAIQGKDDEASRLGKIISIKTRKIVKLNKKTARRAIAHVAWVKRATETCLGDEFADSSMLFLSGCCDNVELDSSVRMVGGPHDIDGPSAQGSMPKFVCKFIYNDDGSFTDAARVLGAPDPTGQICSLCSRHDGAEPRYDEVGQGISYRGYMFHVDDPVLASTGKTRDKCNVGVIRRIIRRDYMDEISVELELLPVVGEITALPDTLTLRTSERHRYVCNQTIRTGAVKLLRPCEIRTVDFARLEEAEEWTSSSPYRFYVAFRFPTRFSSWKTRVPCRRLSLCRVCVSDRVETEDPPDGSTPAKLRCFDLFAGSGALGMAMEASGGIDVTHALDIMPSAAETLKANGSPHTTVYCQDVSEVLAHTVNTWSGRPSQRPRNLHDDSPLADPPPRDSIDVVVAGVLCTEYSGLNRFPNVNSPKRLLILPTLSWVDWLRPKYFIFENVPGFYKAKLLAEQDGPNRLKGGIEMGYARFMIHALLKMDYQVRFRVLQAAHYGAPQCRERFFIIAAKLGLPLPDFPEPTHTFPTPTEKHKFKNVATICLPNGDEIKPLQAQGRAPFRAVSVDDAIGDLVPWDYDLPEAEFPHSQGRRERDDVQRFTCVRHMDAYGPLGAEYASEPRTPFQKHCRRRPPGKSLQHFTLPLLPATTERVMALPMIPGADSLSFDQRYWEPQTAHYTSALARAGFTKGTYRRLDGSKYFSTTSTNMHPTAKQCWVVHPHCRRILTVRELARSQGFPDHFMFVAEGVVTPENDNYDRKGSPAIIKKYQRLIGNAVPWPLGEALGRELRKAHLEELRTNIIDVED